MCRRAAVSKEQGTKKKLEELQILAAKEMPVILLGSFHSVITYSNKLDGVLRTVQPVFWNIKVKK